jgi:predicted cupin superfamily sugar epimerase
MNQSMPELPYAGTSGYSGTDTSEDRARIQDSNGTTSKRQKETLMYLWMQHEQGVTWKEIADELGLHHGSASGVLSVLHLAGRIERLAETRNRCKVYVLPEYVAGRKTELHRGKKSAVHNCWNCGVNL